MVEAHIRSRVQPLFDALGKAVCVPLAISPNHITACAFLFGIATATAIVLQQPYTALACMLLSGLCDILDGTVARLTNTAQPIGAYIDLITDRMVEALIIIGFATAYPQHHMAYLLFSFAVLLHFSTFVAAGALLKNTGQKSMHHDHSILERAEAFAVFALMLLFPAHIFPILMVFNSIIIGDGIARFYRVVSHTQIL